MTFCIKITSDLKFTVYLSYNINKNVIQFLIRKDDVLHSFYYCTFKMHYGIL